ncbi:MAG: ribosomal protein [Alphaproteobacteria bacterium]|nr:ribosomal protein [Alphaproteobacteria bacterium]
MAKIGVVNKMNRVGKMVKQQRAKRATIKAELNKARIGELEFEQVIALQEQLNKLPRNGSAVRFRNRCRYDGRPRGYMGAFGMNRVLFRKLANEGKIPGVVKSSW